jgi:hypothetical protein
MFEFLKRLFGKRESTQSADVDPLTAMALTTDTSSDEPISDAPENSGEDAVASDDGYDGGGDDFDLD